jgi:AcrR family transcriptional regulator
VPDRTARRPRIGGADHENPAARGREAALRLARRHFLDGRRIEMKDIADELRVSRMTLNRWVGSRDKLLGEINWSLARPTLDRARTEAGGSGVEAVAETLQRFIATVLAAPFMQTFLRREGEIALRILTTRSSDTQHNFIAYVRRLLDEELPGADIGMPADDVAYLLVRIAESFCYVDLITGDAPDASKVGPAVRLLLSGAHAHRPRKCSISAATRPGVS